MPRPTWATVVGILGIIFAALGIISHGYTMMVPPMLEMQRGMLDALEDIAETTAQEEAARSSAEPAALPSDTSADEFAEPGPPGVPSGPRTAPVGACGVPSPEISRAALRPFKQMFGEVPEWLGPASVTLALLGIATTGLYMASSIFLLVVKPWAPTMFYVAVTASMIIRVARTVMFASIGSFVGMYTVVWSVPGFAVDVALLTVVAVGDKRAFRPELEQYEHGPVA
jgi:hypothetical protein